MPIGDKNKCTYCGKEELCTRDHFFPKSRGGRILVWACRECNYHKQNLMPKAWIDGVIYHGVWSKNKKERIINSVQELISELPINEMFYISTKRPVPKKTKKEKKGIIPLRKHIVIRCKCGVEKHISRINQYTMIRFWVGTQYLGAVNTRACNVCDML